MHILFYASLPFFVETAFEMYVLTLIGGPQMLFFSLAHIGGMFLISLLTLSALAFILFFVIGVSLVISKAAGKIQGHNREMARLNILLVLQVVHIALLFTYETWSNALFSISS
jgi:hypothetical protein